MKMMLYMGVVVLPCPSKFRRRMSMFPLFFFPFPPLPHPARTHRAPSHWEEEEENASAAAAAWLPSFPPGGLCRGWVGKGRVWKGGVNKEYLPLPSLLVPSCSTQSDKKNRSSQTFLKIFLKKLWDKKGRKDRLKILQWNTQKQLIISKFPKFIQRDEELFVYVLFARSWPLLSSAFIAIGLAWQKMPNEWFANVNTPQRRTWKIFLPIIKKMFHNPFATLHFVRHGSKNQSLPSFLAGKEEQEKISFRDLPRG